VGFGGWVSSFFKATIIDMDEPLTNYMLGGRFIPGIGWLGLDLVMAFLQVILIFQLLQVRTSIRCQFRAVFEVVPLQINPTFNRKQK
jgi:hypothetical protein